ncbi:MAG: hypothetical protein EBQ54_08790 [Actinobacteria bacterium]|nr:hypothetical protein [Actinomycetota bacterium]
MAKCDENISITTSPRTNCHGPQRRTVVVVDCYTCNALGVFFSDQYLPTSNENKIDFLMPGILCLAVISTAMVSLGIATGFERSYGVLRRLGTTHSAHVDW